MNGAEAASNGKTVMTATKLFSPGAKARIGGWLLAASVLALASAANAADREKTIIIAQSGQINTLDPLRADYAQTNFSVNALYDTLITYDYDKKIVGRLASEFKVADDVKSVEITLRPDVKFHDGTVLTAKDVAYTLDRMKKLGVGAASLIEGYASTTIKDDTHLVINLDRPSSVFLGALSKVFILNSALVSANAGDNDGQAWLQANDAGSGPFKLVSQPGQDLTVERVADYWDFDAKRPEAIVFRRVDESATKRDEIRAGNVDVAIGITDRDAAGMASDPGIQIVGLDSPLQAEVIFNTRTGPTADPKVRKALRMVYDYEGGLRSIRMGNGTIANGPLPTTMNCRPDLPPVKQDLEAAKKMLEEAGAANLKLSLNFQPAFEWQKTEATLLQSNMREAGVEVELVPIAFPNYLASLKDPNSIPQMMLLEDFAQFPDPGVVLEKGYKSDAIGTNRSGYANPEVDKLIDEALASGDEQKRCEIYAKVQKMIDDDSVMIDMYTLLRPGVFRAGTVDGLKGSPVVWPIAPADLRMAN